MIFMVKLEKSLWKTCKRRRGKYKGRFRRRMFKNWYFECRNRIKITRMFRIENKRVCQNCYKEIDKDTKFCPECGAKQEVNEESSEIEVKEVEVLDNNSNINTDSSDNDLNIENNSEVEKFSEDDVKENLQKTVEVESNLDSNEDEEAKKMNLFLLMGQKLAQLII